MTPSGIFPTYQRVSSLVLVERTHAGPIELFEYGETGLVELVFRRDHAEKVRETARRKHRVRVSVGNLKSRKKKLSFNFFYFKATFQ